MTMHHQRLKVAMILGMMFAFLAPLGCRSEFDNEDCLAICAEVHDCQLDLEFPIGLCQSACIVLVEGDDELEKEASSCATCINDYHAQSCSQVENDCRSCSDLFSVLEQELILDAIGGAGGVGGAGAGR